MLMIMAVSDGTKTGEAYDSVVDQYVELFINKLDEKAMERGQLEDFAAAVLRRAKGPALDLGCGPGHVTAYLASLGVDVFGVDIAGQMLGAGHTRFPHVPFLRGDITQLCFDDGSVGGVVSRYASIHFPPADLAVAVREWARILAPGGSLLMSFNGADWPDQHGEPFDHAVTTAYRADVGIVSGLLAEAGLIEQARHVSHYRNDPRGHPQITIEATKDQ